jgi:predicted RNA-binding Zn-ribbon protein involved in translation (DUF1610 family)
MRCETCKFIAIEEADFQAGCPSCGEETSFRVYE